MSEPVMYKDVQLCDGDCNHCAIIMNPNSWMITKVLNELLNNCKTEDEEATFIQIVNKNCPNLTCCYDCRIDDFVHIEGCKICD